MIAPLYPRQQKTRLSAPTPPGTGKDLHMDSTRKKQATPSVSYESYETDESYETEESERKRVKVKESDCCDAFASRVPSSTTQTAITSEEAGRAILEAIARGLPSPLPLEQHVLGSAWIQHHGQLLEYEHWTDGFTFIRYTKTHPRMRGPLGEWLCAAEAFAAVDASLRRTGATWEQCLYMGRDDVEAAFLDAWDSIKAVPGQHPVDAALSDATCEQVLFKPGALKIEADGYLSFLVLCRHLAKRSRDGEIVLPVEGKLPQVLRVKPMTISRYRAWAVADGLLEPTEPANWKSGRAARFTFNLKRWSEVTQ